MLLYVKNSLHYKCRSTNIKMKRKREYPSNKRKREEDELVKSSKQRLEGQFHYTEYEYRMMLLKLIAQNQRLLKRVRDIEQRYEALLYKSGTTQVPVDCI